MEQLRALLKTANEDNRVDCGAFLASELWNILEPLNHCLEEIQRAEDADRAHE
jgi:hypothetical protein